MASEPPEWGYIRLNTVVWLTLTSNAPATEHGHVYI